MTCFMDGDKGGVKAFRDTFENAARFECSKHLGDNISQRRDVRDMCGAFQEALDAMTLPALKAAIDAFPPQLRTYLGKRYFQEMFPAARVYDWRGNWRGTTDIAQATTPKYSLFSYTTSQLVEAMNGANKPARVHGMNPLVAILELANMECERYEKQRPGPGNHMTLTPNTDKRLAKMKEELHAYECKNSIDRLDQVDRRAVHLHEAAVYQPGKPHVPAVIAKVSRESKACNDCTCGAYKLDSFPCIHMLKVAQETAVNMIELVPVCFHMSTLRQQYPPGINSQVPTRHEVYEAGHPENTRVGGVKPAQKGRPRGMDKRKMKPGEGKRAMFHCNVCYRAGCRSNYAKCPGNLSNTENLSNEEEAGEEK
ncbi:unnamed protein product [Chrysoparadoxa australica]